MQKKTKASLVGLEQNGSIIKEVNKKWISKEA